MCEGRPGGFQGGVIPFVCEGRPGGFQGGVVFPSGVKEDQLSWVVVFVHRGTVPLLVKS